MDGGLRAFQSFMDDGGSTTLFLWSLACAVSFPFLVLVHELGHASVGLVRTRGLVRVHVGREPGVLHRRFGRLHVSLDPRRGQGRGGFAKTFAAMTRGEAIAYVVAGPAANALVAVPLLLTGSPVLQVVGGYAALLAGWNLIPHGQSDGAMLRRFLREREWRTRTALDDLVAAANTASADVTRNLVGGRRVVLKDGTTDPAVLRAAYLGWCWGDASESNFPREAALDALHTATRSGAFGPALTIAAARELAALPQRPGRHIEIGVRPALVPGCDEQAVRQAFVYGIAVRDIERIRR